MCVSVLNTKRVLSGGGSVRTGGDISTWQEVCVCVCVVVVLQVEVCDEGLCRVGWSTLAASYDIGTDRHSFG